MIKDSNYNIVQLGIGKYTKVYSIELDTGKKIAVKVLKSKFEKNKFYQDLLIKQARTGMQVQHSNVRKVFDVVYDDDDNTYQVMMEYLEGYNMQQYIENFGSIPAAQVEQWLKRILPALMEAHRKGLVHGHLKPGNLFITPKGDLKICDFAGPLFENELFPEDVEGDDILYLSPEQIQQIGPITALTDIYSLGVTLYTLLSGKDPYDIKDFNTDTTRLRILNDVLPFIDNISLKLNSLIQSCTAKNPKERFPLMESILAELDGGEFKRKSEIIEEGLFSSVSEQPEEKIIQPTHNDVQPTEHPENPAPETDHKDDVIPSPPEQLASTSIHIDQEPTKPTDHLPDPVVQETYEKSDHTKVVIPPPMPSDEEIDNVDQEDANKATLEERAQAIWDRLGVTKDNNDGPKVTVVPTVKSVDEFVAKGNENKKSKQQPAKVAGQTEPTKVQKPTTTSNPEFKTDQSKPIPPTTSKQPDVVVTKKPSDPQQPAPAIQKEIKAVVEKAGPNHNQSGPKPPDVTATPARNNQWIWLVTSLLIGVIGGYYGYTYWKNSQKNVLTEQVPTTIVDENTSNDPTPVGTSPELSESVIDSLIDSDSVANLLLLEQAKLDQLKLQEAERLRQEEARKARELANAIDKTKIELQGPYIANIAPFKYNGLIGFIDRDGKVIKKPVYAEILTFNGGLAAVKNTSNLWGFVNSEGNEIIKPQYSEIFGFSKGLAGAMKNGKWGFINSKGVTVVPFSYDLITDFNDNLAGVRRGGKWGFVNTKGTEVISCQFDNAWSFRDGLAGVEKNGKWGFINKSGAAVIPLKYNQVNNFSEGLACVEFNRKFGFIDKSGNEVVDFIYDAAKPFTNGTARVFDGSKWIYINKSGKCVRDCN